MRSSTMTLGLSEHQQSVPQSMERDIDDIDALSAFPVQHQKMNSRSRQNQQQQQQLQQQQDAENHTFYPTTNLVVKSMSDLFVSDTGCGEFEVFTTDTCESTQPFDINSSSSKSNEVKNDSHHFNHQQYQPNHVSYIRTNQLQRSQVNGMNQARQQQQQQQQWQQGEFYGNQPDGEEGGQCQSQSNFASLYRQQTRTVHNWNIANKATTQHYSYNESFNSFAEDEEEVGFNPNYEYYHNRYEQQLNPKQEECYRHFMYGSPDYQEKRYYNDDHQQHQNQRQDNNNNQQQPTKGHHHYPHNDHYNGGGQSFQSQSCHTTSEGNTENNYGGMKQSPPQQSLQSSSRSNSISSDSSRPLEIEVTPGIFMKLRGSKETQQAIDNNFVQYTSCFACTIKLLCIADAEFIICPECKTISPTVELEQQEEEEETVAVAGSSNSNKVGGVGLGLRVQEEVVAECG